jgi:RNase P/RNase MRP subunit p29
VRQGGRRRRERERGIHPPVTLLGYKVELNTGRSVIKGTLVDETARTIVVRTGDGSLRRLPKDQLIEVVVEVSRGVRLRTEGRKLIGLPAERLKRAMRYGWSRSI